jgi:hypothetical protein
MRWGFSAGAAASVWAIAAAANAAPVNLVTNGSFEGPVIAGNGNNALDQPSGWVFTPAANGSFAGVVAGGAHSGANTYTFEATGGLNDTISQTIATVVGHHYEVRFWLRPDGNTGTDFTASFGGQPLADLTDLPIVNDPANHGYELFSMFTTASSGASDLVLGGRDRRSEFFLDDVAVFDVTTTSVAEPGTLAVLVAGLAGFRLVRRRQLL